MNLVMQNNAIVNLDNIARMVMESAIRRVEFIDSDAARKKKYLLAVRNIADKIKMNQELTSVERDSTL